MLPNSACVHVEFDAIICIVPAKYTYAQKPHVSELAPLRSTKRIVPATLNLSYLKRRIIKIKSFDMPQHIRLSHIRCHRIKANVKKIEFLTTPTIYLYLLCL